MKISHLIALLESEMDENGDTEIMIYDSRGDLIEPKGFHCGARSTDHGWVDTVSFSDLD